ncbi:hypothetical protein ERO13_D09G027850v2 [Gossypium hirsutum]|nr:hypothetical protein ERO13_D09G027850v2 [Gossypium hirsutum]
MALQSFFQVFFLALISFLFLYCLMRNKNGCPKSSPGIVELLLNVHRIHDWCTETLESCKGTFVLEGLDVRYLWRRVFNSDMDLWENQRIAAQGFMRHHLFHQFLLRTIRDKVEMGLMPIIDHAAKHGLVINLEDIFRRFTFDSAFLFSKAVDDFEQAILFRHVRPRSFTKLQKWLNIGQEGKYKKAWKVLDDVLAEYICQKRKEANKLNQKLVSVDCLKCDNKLLRDTTLNMITAATTDTMSTALTWFTWLVSKHPIVENKIIEELESKTPIGETKRRRLFNVDEVKNLVYLHRALCEALRLYPPIPFNHKEPVKPDMLPSGHPVHPKTKVLFSVYSMGRMKSIWGEDCYEFKPERWINERGEIKHERSYTFLSFGAGPRICLGKETSFIQMKVVASALIYNYRIHVMEETPIVPTVSIVLHTKNGLMTRISKR